MIISNITPPQVWSASARSLTNFGSGALAPTNTITANLAGASSIDLRTSPGIVSTLTVGVITGAAATGSMVVQIYDGTNTIQVAVTAAAATSPAGFSMVNNNTVGMRLNNADATHLGSYMIASTSMTI